MKPNTILLCVGAFGLGFGTCYLALRERFDRRLDAQIDAINQAFDREMGELGLEKTTDTPVKSTDSKIFRSEIKKHNYDSYFTPKSEEKVPSEATESPKEGGIVEPYIINASQFATDRTLDKISLTYYINADLVCEEEEVIEDIDAVLGTDFMNHFHDDEEGVVYVRNERLGADYEVILDDSDGEFIKARFGFET